MITGIGFDRSAVGGYKMTAIGQLLMRTIAVVLSCAAIAERANADPRPVVELPLTEKPDLEFRPRCEWLSFSPDGRWLAARYQLSETKACIRVWSCADWKTTDLQLDSKRSIGWNISQCCAFDPKSTKLYVASNGILYAHSLPPKGAARITALPETAKPDNAAYAVSFLQEDKTLQVITDDQYGHRLRVDRFQAADPESRTPVFSEKLKVDCTPTVSPDGGLIAVGLSTEQKDFASAYSLEVWSVVPAKRRVRYEGLNDSLAVIRFSPDGQVLATGGRDGTLTLYDVPTGKLIRTLTEDYTVSSVDFHPTKPFLAFTTFDGKGNPNLRIVDLPSGKIVGSKRVDLHGTRQVCFSPNGKTLATVGGEAFVRVWELDGLIEK
jgi:WD40 repeat protein